MSWAQIHGHSPNIERFSRALATHRLGHAYLFTGPSGVGKKLFAIELAKYLLCESRSNSKFDSCDQCASCHLVAANTHPDLMIVGKPADKHELPIAIMQDLCEKLSLKPARGSMRVAIVDDGDDFNEESANCFLKTLEEPPPGSLLIILGTDADRMISTIRSRCQVVDFKPLPADELKQMLRTSGVTDLALIDRLTRLADGSPGLARELADPAYWSFRKSFLEELGKAKPDSSALAKEYQRLYELAGKDTAAQRHRVGLILRLILDALRLAARDDEAAFADPVEGPLLEAIVQRFGPDGLLDRMERCLDAEAQNDRRVQLLLVVEAVVDALTQDNGVVNFRPAWSL